MRDADGPLFRPVEKSRAFERVVEQIEMAIINGDLKAGDHLPSERALVENFGVGRSTVREALRILESIGLLKTEPGSPKGPRIAPSKTIGLRRILNGVMRMENISVVELIQYRMIIGSAANRLAAAFRTDEDILEMERALAGMEDADDTAEFSRNDAAWHAIVERASRNTLITIISEVINELIVSLISDTLDQSGHPTELRHEFINDHRATLDAIGSRDVAMAAKNARESYYRVYSQCLAPKDAERLAALL